MTIKNQLTADIKETIEQLIKAGTTFDVEKLENIYHKELEVIMIDEKGETMFADKEAFKSLFQTKQDNAEAPLNNWAVFHHIKANNRSGHVLISRKVKLTDEERKLVLSIDLIHENNRWQVTREVIFSQPLS